MISSGLVLIDPRLGAWLAAQREGGRARHSSLVLGVAVLLVAAGSTIGGLLGASCGRRLPSAALRWLIVVVGVVSVKLLFFS